MIVGVCTTFEEMRDSIAAYCQDVQDDVKLLARLSVGRARRPTAQSIKYLLDAFDLEVVIRERCAVSPVSDAHEHTSGGKARRKPHFKDWRRNRGASWGRRMNGLRNLRLSQPQRSAIARKAAQARWARRGALTPTVTRENTDSEPEKGLSA
jgi:hypothetical protein